MRTLHLKRNQEMGFWMMSEKRSGRCSTKRWSRHFYRGALGRHETQSGPAEGQMKELIWDWDNSFWTTKNRHRCSFQVCCDDTQIKTCSDPEMNFETGTSLASEEDEEVWERCRPGQKSVEQLWKETKWKEPERREEKKKDN